MKMNPERQTWHRRPAKKEHGEQAGRQNHQNETVDMMGTRERTQADTASQTGLQGGQGDKIKSPELKNKMGDKSGDANTEHTKADTVERD